MGARSYGYGEITISPAITIEPDSEWHPESRSGRLVRVVLDEQGQASKLEPWGMDGLGKWLSEQFLQDIDDFVRTVPLEVTLDGFLEHEEDDGPGDLWCATPVRGKKHWRTYQTRPTTKHAPHTWPEDVKKHGVKVRRSN